MSFLCTYFLPATESAEAESGPGPLLRRGSPGCRLPPPIRDHSDHEMEVKEVL